MLANNLPNRRIARDSACQASNNVMERRVKLDERRLAKKNEFPFPWIG
jgi:hypothetical protein